MEVCTYNSHELGRILRKELWQFRDRQRMAKLFMFKKRFRQTDMLGIESVSGDTLDQRARPFLLFLSRMTL